MLKITKAYSFFAILAVSLFLIPSPGLADTLGQRVSFNVNEDFDKYGRTTLNATLRYMGGKVYFYVDDSYWNGLTSSRQNLLADNMKILGSEFDNNIYPKETSFWGSEANPGIDGDSKITLLLEELIDNNGGYFDTANGYSKIKINDSNEREMVAINADILAADIFVAKMFLAHEFQHIISFNHKEKAYNLSEDVWLNELRSEYSISRVGYNDNYLNSNLDRRAAIFSDNSYDSLTEWPNKNLDYAMVALFSEYLVEQYGANILMETLSSPFTGISSLNEYLRIKNYYERFDDIFLNWLGALYLDDVSINEKFGYKRAELKDIKLLPQQSILLSEGLKEYSTTQYIKDWQPLLLEFNVSALSGGKNQSARIDISGEPDQKFIASYLAFYDPPAGGAGSGSVEAGKINIISGQGKSYIFNSDKKLNKIVVLATKATKISRFGASEPANFLNVGVSMVDNSEARANSIKDGVLIKRPREKEIYVIWGKYKRYLNPEIIALYGHLDPANAIEVGPEIFDSYITSNYVKYVDDKKVYAVWPDGTKHWLRITAKQWDDSRRDWNAIFTISDLEVNYYKAGNDITR